MLTTEIFLTPVYLGDFGAVIGKDCFKGVKRVLISSLHPRQAELCEGTLQLKIKGRFHTKSYVIQHEGKNILIDGHHTTASKFIKGQKFINALFLNLDKKD